ncbi:sporulation protein Cse60 [Geomicrobium sp. JCM 19055]|uniref:sporulation protein Cse60 n=1 Tax=Geomicrobium sp. JCM 19055 TaxID=1460649 RepID=UPI001267ED6F
MEKLQSKINEFIRNLVWCDIVDIKYETWRDTDESYMATAMVIYKAKPLLKKG